MPDDFYIRSMTGSFLWDDDLRRNGIKVGDIDPFQVGDIVTCFNDGDEWVVTEADPDINGIIKTRCIKEGKETLEGRRTDREEYGEEDLTMHRKRNLVRTAAQEHERLARLKETLRGKETEIEL